VIEASMGLIIGISLLVLLAFVTSSKTRAERDAPGWDSPRGDVEVCPPEFVAGIFSRSDWNFISGTGSLVLQEAFLAERKKVALFWLRQTRQAIGAVMEKHAAFARQSEELEFTTEVKIFFLYAELRLICLALLALINVAGPLWLNGVAVQAGKLSQRIRDVQENLQLAASELR
jgi:hypothetical protein